MTPAVGGIRIALLQKIIVMKLLTTILVGAAVAGVIYYLVDREGAEELLGEVSDAAKDAYGKMNDSLADVKQKFTGATTQA